MKAIVNTGPGRLEMLEWPMPEAGPGQVRVRTGACGICATDLEMIAGWDRTGFPSIPGHEWSGTVDTVGPGVQRTLLGRCCVAENVLSDGGEVGFEHPGGYAEYLVTEADKVHVLSDSFPLDTAALIEPLAVCVRGMHRLCGKGTRRALVLGDGPIGLLSVALLARASVEQIVMVGGRNARLALGRELGASAALNYHDLGGRLADVLGDKFSDSFNVVVEATGSETGISAAIRLVAREGKVLVLGDYRDLRAEFRWNDLLHREIEIIGSNASAEAWPEAVRLAVDGSVSLERLITHRCPAGQFEEGIALVRSRRDDVVKVVIDWESR